MCKTIPAAPIRKALQMYLDDHQLSTREFAQQHDLPSNSVVYLLEDAKEVVFDLADVIVCKINQPFLFLSDALREAYFNVDLSGPIRLVSQRGKKQSDVECDNGHTRTEKNTRFMKRSRGGPNQRRCLDCQRQKAKNYRKRKKAERMTATA